MSIDPFCCSKKIRCFPSAPFGCPARHRPALPNRRTLRSQTVNSHHIFEFTRRLVVAWTVAASSYICYSNVVLSDSTGFFDSDRFCRAMDSFRSTQQSLVSYLKHNGRVRSSRVEQALLGVDRKYFVDRSMPMCLVYQDMPLPIGHDETISAPHMHATCLDLLKDYLSPGARVLDVGSGSGYLSACMGLLVQGENGTVVGIEKHPELAAQSIQNIQDSNPDLLGGDKPTVSIKAGNVLSDIMSDYDPFDAIHVGAAAASLPDVLVRKLKPGGRLVIPVGPRNLFQELMCVDKGLDGDVHIESLMNVRYVPLTHPKEEEEPVSVE